MATYNGNDVYLSLGGTDVSAYYTDELAFNRSNALQEITAGAGATDIERGKGLNDTQLDLVLVYDSDDLANYISLIDPGDELDVIYGPNTNGIGNPTYSGKMRVASVSHAVNIAKNLVKFTISLQGSAAPTSRIHNGDTF